jgi:hypothetical protein
VLLGWHVRLVNPRHDEGSGRLERSLLAEAVERPIALGGKTWPDRRSGPAETPCPEQPAPSRVLTARVGGGAIVREKFGESFSATRCR